VIGSRAGTARGWVRRITGTMPTMRDGEPTGSRTRRRAGQILYWLAVTVTSLALVVGLLLLMQSCDESTVGAAVVAFP
jgi:hypothetical protein